MFDPQFPEIYIKKQEAHDSMYIIQEAIVYLPVILDQPELPDGIYRYIDDQRRYNIDPYRFVNRWLDGFPK
jgi:hypothetical protein